MPRKRQVLGERPKCSRRCGRATLNRGGICTACMDGEPTPQQKTSAKNRGCKRPDGAAAAIELADHLPPALPRALSWALRHCPANGRRLRAPTS